MDADPVRQREGSDSTLRSLIEGLQRRRSAPQNEPRTLELGANGRRVPRVISRHGALFVTGFVLFIDDDGAEPLHGRKDSRSWADRDEAFAAPQRAPRIGALAAEHAAHARDGLGSECDLRHEQDCASTGRDDSAQDFQIHERLARARDAMQQHRHGDRRGLYARDDVALIFGQRRRWGRGHAGKGIAHLRDALDASETLSHQALEGIPG